MSTPITYHRPKTLTEALGLATQMDVVPLAAGLLTLENLTPPFEIIIDVQDIPELRRIEQTDINAVFGSAVALQSVLDWTPLPTVFRRALTRAIPLDLRYGISIGESLRLWKTPMLREWSTVMLAHDVGIQYVNKDGELSWDNMIGLLEAGRLDQEFITAIDLPTLREGQALGAAYVARTSDGAPIVNVTAFLYVDAGQRVESEFIFVSGASAQPIVQVRLGNLITNPLDEANIGSAVKGVVPQLDPVGDALGSAEYRAETARVLIQQALTECMEQLV